MARGSATRSKNDEVVLICFLGMALLSRTRFLMVRIIFYVASGEENGFRKKSTPPDDEISLKGESVQLPSRNRGWHGTGTVTLDKIQHFWCLGEE